MALEDSYLTDGTVSVANGATTYTFVGVALITSGVRSGDKLIKDGHTIVFTDDPASETSIEGEAWPGTTLSGATYRIEFLPDGSRLTAKLQELLTAIGDSGNVDALAALVGAADKLPYFTGPGAMALADFTADARDLLARWTRATSTSQAKLVFHEDTDNGTNTLTVQPPAALGGNRVIELPDVDITVHTAAKALLEAGTAAAQRAATGAIGGSTGATDNRLLRSDGTGGATAQASAVTVDDSGNVTSAGYILGSGQPAFRATWAAAFTAIDEIDGMTEQFDVAGNFNPTTGRFTAPFAGRFQFNATVLNQNAAVVGSIYLAVNGTVLVAGRAAAAAEQMSVSAVLDLALSDYVSCFIQNGVTLNSTSFASFSGHLIG